MSLKIGDLVQLKSGGPVMTVTSTRQSDAIQCSWFPTIESLNPSTTGFPPDSLKESKE